jgi:hypothetical protein
MTLSTCLACAFWLSSCVPLQAGKIPVSPEQLAQSKLIVVGKVLTYRTEDNTHTDGSIVKSVLLEVLVESVAKGGDEGKVMAGDKIEARCWRVVRAPRDGIVWDLGDHFIPAPDGRAKFFFENGSGTAWSPHWPNGIEKLDDTPGLEFPMEKAEEEGPSHLESRDPVPVSLLVISGAGLFLILIVFAVVFLRKG